jgi:hypothetical protein
VITIEEAVNFRAKKGTWENEVAECLMKSFALDKNAFFHEFLTVNNRSKYYTTGKQRDITEETKVIKESILDKIDYLTFNLKIISVCDYISKGTNKELIGRQKYSTTKKLSLILKKLYELNDGSYYPIRILLEGNGVQLKSSAELRELMVILEDNGYVDRIGGLGDDDVAKITAKGSICVEEKPIAYSENYDDISSSQSDINDRIDEIITHLKNLGLGQEILFDELQELNQQFYL